MLRDLWRKIRGQKAGEQVSDAVPGIFCDCLGTLFDFRNTPDETLVAYLNAQHAKGRKVVVFSTVPGEVEDTVRAIGLHPDIVDSLCDKRDYMGWTLEILIDDRPLHGIGALRHWDPRTQAFKDYIKAEIERDSARPQGPIPR